MLILLQTNANKAQTILENGVLSQQAIAQAMDELWMDVLNSPIYDGMANLGVFFFLGTIAIWIFSMVKESLEKGDVFIPVEQWLIALVVVVLLMNQGQLLKEQTLNMRNLLNAVSEEILSSSLVQSQSLIDAFNQISAQGGIQTWYEQQLNQCQQITDQTARSQCIDDALLAANEAANAGLPNAPQNSNWLQRLGNGLTGGIGSALETALIGILLALGVVIQWFTEFTWILTALVGPLALGGTLLPVRQKAIYTWLIAFYSVGLYKLFFNILIGLTAIVQLKSNSTNSLIFAVATGLVSPILAMALAVGGGMTTFTSLGALAGVASAKLGAMASGGVGTMGKTMGKMGVRVGVRNVGRVGRGAVRGASNSITRTYQSINDQSHPALRRIRATGDGLASSQRGRQVVGMAKRTSQVMGRAARQTYQDATTPLRKRKEK